jgi:ribose transport system substrate-binding protein
MSGGSNRDRPSGLPSSDEVMRARHRTEILVGGVDAMPPAIRAVVDGSMYATVGNSSCRIHGGAIVAGVEAALAGKKTPATPPKQIVVDGPIVTQANAPGLLWMEDHFLI